MKVVQPPPLQLMSTVCSDSNLLFACLLLCLCAGGYLFAVVDPLETLVQFGLRIGPAAGPGQSELSLYHTHPEDRFVSKVWNPFVSQSQSKSN